MKINNNIKVQCDGEEKFITLGNARVTVILLDDMTAEINRCDKSISGDVVIPSAVRFNHRKYVVTKINCSAFTGCSSLFGIHIPNTITKIGSSAFMDCSSLASIYIPNRVK